MNLLTVSKVKTGDHGNASCPVCKTIYDFLLSRHRIVQCMCGHYLLMQTNSLKVVNKPRELMVGARRTIDVRLLDPRP